ncbi:MAG: hypothetical protein ACFHX7_18865 [Pseudomonadota bacterium]
MKMSLDISLYPLSDECLPAIDEFIERIQQHPDMAVTRGDLSTLLFGDFDVVMDFLKQEMRISWEKFDKGIFVIKFLMDDLRGLSTA